MNRLKQDMYRALLDALKGWWFYHRLIKKYKLQRTKICLIPDQEGKYLGASLLYLDQMLQVQGYDSAVILTVPVLKKAEAELFSDRIELLKKISRKKAEQLMQFYCLYNFDVRFVICSLDEPTGRQGSGLVGKRGITQEEVFAVGVYGIPDYIQFVPSPYRKKDQKILRFLNRKQQHMKMVEKEEMEKLWI